MLAIDQQAWCAAWNSQIDEYQLPIRLRKCRGKAFTDPRIAKCKNGLGIGAVSQLKQRQRILHCAGIGPGLDQAVVEAAAIERGFAREPQQQRCAHQK
jgi:hypothetical protein